MTRESSEELVKGLNELIMKLLSHIVIKIYVFSS